MSVGVGRHSVVMIIGGSSPSCWEGPSLLFLVRGEGRSPRSKGSSAGNGILGEGQPSKGLGNAVCSPGRRDPVFLHSKGASWPLLELVGGQGRGGGHGPLPPPPLNSPVVMIHSLVPRSTVPAVVLVPTRCSRRRRVQRRKSGNSREILKTGGGEFWGEVGPRAFNIIKGMGEHCKLPSRNSGTVLQSPKYCVVAVVASNNGYAIYFVQRLHALKLLIHVILCACTPAAGKVSA